MLSTKILYQKFKQDRFMVDGNGSNRPTNMAQAANLDFVEA